ncbi:NUDIX domain-containing protein [Leptolyngbya sp. AN02str]|uniref:NUDIX domain-containing protein n=1 Tax=Leptolyngbya sp. AN02str TaxID=3423363 RepID=UPI003D316AFB
MAKKSAGLLMYRLISGQIEVLLVHPGGPFWAKKDEGCWSIPKGEYLEGENAFAAAKREFEEETGFTPIGEFLELQEVKQSGKRVKAWAFEGDFDLKLFRSNLFTMEYPPRSGRLQEFPEADRAGWFRLTEARLRLLKAQHPFLDELQSHLARGTSTHQRT